MQEALKDILKREITFLILVLVVILFDVIPIISIMAGIWIVKYFSNLFGFSELTPIKFLIVFEQIFMVFFYVALVVFTVGRIWLWDRIEQASLNYALSNYHVNPSSNVFSGNISFG